MGLRGRFGEVQERASGDAGPEPCKVGVKQTQVGSWPSLARREAHEGGGQRAVLLERMDDGQTAASVLQETATFAQAGLCSHAVCLDWAPASSLLQALRPGGPKFWGTQMSSPEPRWGQGRKWLRPGAVESPTGLATTVLMCTEVFISTWVSSASDHTNGRGLPLVPMET